MKKKKKQKDLSFGPRRGNPAYVTKRRLSSSFVTSTAAKLYTRMLAKSRTHFILLPHLFLLLQEGTFLIKQKDFIIQKENDMLAASSTVIVLRRE